MVHLFEPTRLSFQTSWSDTKKSLLPVRRADSHDEKSYWAINANLVLCSCIVFKLKSLHMNPKCFPHSPVCFSSLNQIHGTVLHCHCVWIVSQQSPTTSRCYPTTSNILLQSPITSTWMCQRNVACNIMEYRSYLLNCTDFNSEDDQKCVYLSVVLLSFWKWSFRAFRFD